MPRKIEVEIVGDSRSVERAFGRAGAAGSGLGRTLGKALKIGAVAAAAGLLIAGKSAIDFESSFAGVRKTVDGSPAQLAEIGQGMRDMAKEIPLGVNQLNAIGEAAGQLGVRRGAILGFTRTMADLGETTNLAGEEGAATLARFANITQMAQGDFDRLGSTIVALGNAGASTEAEIAAMGLRIAGAGRQIGLTEPQILGIANALSSVGIEAEAGGTAISKVMIEIAKEVKSGGDRLAEFAEVAGMSSSDFKKAFERDAAGALVTFIEGLGKLSESGGNTFKVLEDLELGEVRVRDALLRASGAGDLLRDSLDLGSKAWQENNALSEEAAKRYETTAAQLQILKNRINDVAIEAGQRLLPMLNAALERAMDGLERHGDSISRAFDLASDALGKTATVAGEVAGVVNTDLGISLSGAGAGAILFAAGFGKVASSAKKAKLALLGVNPLIGTLSIILGTIAFAYISASRETDKFAEATDRAKKALQGLKTAADGARQADLDLAAARNTVKAASLAVSDAERELARARKDADSKPRDIRRAEISLEAARIGLKQANQNVALSEMRAAAARQKVNAQTKEARTRAAALGGEVRKLSDEYIRARSPQTRFGGGMQRVNEEARKKHVADFARQAADVAKEGRKVADQLAKTNPRLARTASNAAAAAQMMSDLSRAWGRVVDLPSVKAFVARFRVITTVEDHRVEIGGSGAMGGGGGRRSGGGGGSRRSSTSSTQAVPGGRNLVVNVFGSPAEKITEAGLLALLRRAEILAAR